MENGSVVTDREGRFRLAGAGGDGAPRRFPPYDGDAIYGRPDRRWPGNRPVPVRRSTQGHAAGCYQGHAACIPAK